MTEIKMADDAESEKRIEDIKILMSYFLDKEDLDEFLFVSDESYLSDFYDIGDESEERDKILSHFPVEFKIDENKPIWGIVDYIKRKFPQWPLNTDN